MKKMALFFLLISTLVITACGQEPLKSRNLIEADQYIRNNINDMSWSQFQLLLNSKNDVTEKDFKTLRKVISLNDKTSFVEVKDKIYRFNDKKQFMYMTVWAKKGNVLYLQDINYVNH